MVFCLFFFFFSLSFVYLVRQHHADSPGFGGGGGAVPSNKMHCLPSKAGEWRRARAHYTHIPVRRRKNQKPFGMILQISI